MKVWIDLSNSPHALLFASVSRRLEELGHTVFATARDNAQTAQLGRPHWPNLEIVGTESPRDRVAKARSLGVRVAALRRVARREQPDLALSHNSYAQIVAAKLSGVRTVTAMDYEFQPANHVAFRLADRILLPQVLRATRVQRQGAHDDKTRYYPGFKEEFYLGDFVPQDDVLSKLGIDVSGKVLVVARTPPSRALYHQFENQLFNEVLQFLGSNGDIACVVLPRHTEQRQALDALGLPSLVVPRSAVDSRSLMYAADLVVGAGGTMTREAALLGVPTISVFAGAMPAVDAALIESGLLRRIETLDELGRVEPRGDTGRALLELAERREELLSWLIAAVGLAPRAHGEGEKHDGD